jgi:hypothetical protein
VQKSCDVFLGISQKLAERQRMILLADNSECGWMTVKNYQGDDWALSNRDQQKMAQAEAKAQRDVAARLERQRSRSPSPSGRGRGRSPYRKPFFGQANNPSFKALTALPAASTVINVQGDIVPKLMILPTPGDKSNKK